MPAPYALWDDVPVYIHDPESSQSPKVAGSYLASWDMFFRDYQLPPSKPTHAQLSPHEPNTPPTFSPIEINIDKAKYDQAIAWHKQQIRDGVRDGIAANQGAMALI